MTWKDILKEDKGLLSTLSAKEKKKIKKILSSAEPSEYFGQDFAKMGELVDVMKELDLIKGDKKMAKKMKTLSEKNVDIVYPKSKGMRKK